MKCERYWREGILLVERGERDPHRDTCDDCRRAHHQREQLIRALPDVGGRATGAADWQAQVWSRIAREETARARRSYWISGGLVVACAVVAVCVTWMTRKSSSPAGAVARSGTGDAADHGVGPQSAARVNTPPGGGSAADSKRRDGWAPVEVHASYDAGPNDHRLPVQIATLTDRRPHLQIIKGKIPVRGTVSAAVHDRVQYAVPPRSEVRMYRADRLVLRCPPQRASPGCVPDAQGLVAEAELITAGEYHLVVISPVAAEPVGTLDGDLAAVIAAGGDYKLTELSVR